MTNAGVKLGGLSAKGSQKDIIMIGTAMKLCGSAEDAGVADGGRPAGAGRMAPESGGMIKPATKAYPPVTRAIATATATVIRILGRVAMAAQTRQEPARQPAPACACGGRLLGVSRVARSRDFPMIKIVTQLYRMVSLASATAMAMATGGGESQATSVDAHRELVHTPATQVIAEGSSRKAKEIG